MNIEAIIGQRATPNELFGEVAVMVERMGAKGYICVARDVDQVRDFANKEGLEVMTIFEGIHISNYTLGKEDLPTTECVLLVLTAETGAKVWVSDLAEKNFPETVENLKQFAAAEGAAG